MKQGTPFASRRLTSEPTATAVPVPSDGEGQTMCRVGRQIKTRRRGTLEISSATPCPPREIVYAIDTPVTYVENAPEPRRPGQRGQAHAWGFFSSAAQATLLQFMTDVRVCDE